MLHRQPRAPVHQPNQSRYTKYYLRELFEPTGQNEDVWRMLLNVHVKPKAF